MLEYMETDMDGYCYFCSVFGSESFSTDLVLPLPSASICSSGWLLRSPEFIGAPTDWQHGGKHTHSWVCTIGGRGLPYPWEDGKTHTIDPLTKSAHLTLDWLLDPSKHLLFNPPPPPPYHFNGALLSSNWGLLRCSFTSAVQLMSCSQTRLYFLFSIDKKMLCFIFFCLICYAD